LNFSGSFIFGGYRHPFQYPPVSSCRSSRDQALQDWSKDKLFRIPHFVVK